MRWRAQTLITTTCLVVLSGCIFDSRGLSGVYVVLDKGPDPTPELGVDQGSDLATDLSPDMRQVCTNYPKSAVCSFGIQDEVGTTGVCRNGQFFPSRRCFAEAPCSRGSCKLIDLCAPCPSLSCAGVCTAFNQEPGGCCVVASDNGPGTGADPCDSDAQCATGLCTLGGNCFEACDPSWDSCPAGTTCSKVQVTFANRSTKLYFGCKRLTTDAGPPDQGASDAGAPELGPAPMDGAVDSGAQE